MQDNFLLLLNEVCLSFVFFGAGSASNKLSFALAVLLPKYFTSQRSFAQFHLPEGSQCIAAFGHQKNTVIVIGMDGR